jgi:hypothetical protein
MTLGKLIIDLKDKYWEVNELEFNLEPHANILG